MRKPIDSLQEKLEGVNKNSQFQGVERGEMVQSGLSSFRFYWYGALFTFNLSRREITL